jgi:hypothetical protein
LAVPAPMDWLDCAISPNLGRHFHASPSLPLDSAPDLTCLNCTFLI